MKIHYEVQARHQYTAGQVQHFLPRWLHHHSVHVFVRDIFGCKGPSSSTQNYSYKLLHCIQHATDTQDVQVLTTRILFQITNILKLRVLHSYVTCWMRSARATIS
jgi:hypothetical protein